MLADMMASNFLSSPGSNNPLIHAQPNCSMLAMTLAGWIFLALKVAFVGSKRGSASITRATLSIPQLRFDHANHSQAVSALQRAGLNGPVARFRSMEHLCPFA